MNRKKKLVTPRYVASFILKFSATVLLGFGIFGLFTIILTNKKIGPTYAEGVTALSRIQEYLPVTICVTAFLQALTLSLIAVVLGLLWSHGIAGPLVRFRSYLRNIAHGKLLYAPLSFRMTDQLHGLALAFSEMAACQSDISTRALALLVKAQKVLSECEALEKRGANGAEESARKLKELKLIYREIRDIANAATS